MDRNNFHQLSSPIRGGQIKDFRKGLTTLVLLFLGSLLCSAQSGVKQDDVFKGNTVYVNTTGTKKQSDQDYLTYTVIKPTTNTSVSYAGEVSVKATDGAKIKGVLNIPSVIWKNSSYKYYPYVVTTVSEGGFKDQTGISDVYFKQDKQNSEYKITTIGKKAFAGTGLTGVLQLPRTITSFGDSAFYVSTPSTISQVVIGANGMANAPTSLTVGADIFKGRTITRLDILGNFVSKTNFTSGTASFGETAITNLYYYGDGLNSEKVSEDFYDFMAAWTGKGGGPIGENLYLPSDGIKGFVEKCKKNSHQNWIPAIVHSLSFDNEMSGLGTFSFLLYSNTIANGGPQLALRKVKLDDGVTDLKMDIYNDNDKWEPDLMPTETNLSADISMIASNAFAGNNELQSITIKPKDAITINGDAFAGAKGLRYVDLSSSDKFTVVKDYTLSRLPTTALDTIPYRYTRSTGRYDYNLVATNPFGGLPAYTLVFLPTNIKKLDPSESTETVYQTDGTTATTLTRPLDENFLWKDPDDDKYKCNNFGVYDIKALDNTTAAGQKYSWYSFLNPHEFTAEKSKFYRQFSAGVPSSLCLPFKPAATSDGKFYTYKSEDDKHIVLTTVDAPQANTPYFFYPSSDVTLSSSVQQPIGAVTTADKMTDKDHPNFYGVYAGKSFADVSNAYGMASTAFTYNGKSYPAGTFVKFKETAYINPFRAYLLLSGSGAKPAVMEMVVDDTPTGITSLPTASDAEASYYNLQGMRVTAPTKGIFIHNGKKFVK